VVSSGEVTAGTETAGAVLSPESSEPQPAAATAIAVALRTEMKRITTSR
jgi:hypothetical protein